MQEERGSALPLVALAMVVVGILSMGIGRLGQDAAERARARTAADAAALGGAADGRETALELAEANGGEMTFYRRIGADVRVAVRVGRSEAVARATAQAERGNTPSGRRRGPRPIPVPLRR